MKNACLGALLACLAPWAIAQQGPVAYSGARILTGTGEVIDGGLMVVEDGRISAIGSMAAMTIPANTPTVDFSGKTVIPGLVDTHSHVGIYGRPSVAANSDGNEATDPVTPQLRALDAIWPADPGIRMALAGGVTTANIMPGSGNVVGGQTAYVKLRGRTVDEMLIPGSIGGLKMANGENAKRNYGSRGQMPMTRMAEAALARDLFVRAQAYEEAWQRWEDDRDGEPPKRDLQLEPVVEVLNGERIVQHHTHRADDVASVLRLAEEFGFRVVIQHGSEAWKMAPELAAANVPVSFIVIDSIGGKHEVTDYRLDAPKILDDAGVEVSLHTDDFINSSRFLLREAALAIRYGFDETEALKSVTINAARMLDLEERVGSLEPGKDADFVVLSGDPFSVYTDVEQTWIEGRKVFDRADPEDLRYATGGFAVADRYPALEVQP